MPKCEYIKDIEDLLARTAHMRTYAPRRGKSQAAVQAEVEAMGFVYIRDYTDEKYKYRMVRAVCRRCGRLYGDMPLHKLKECKCGPKGETSSKIREEYAGWGKRVIRAEPGGYRLVECLRCGNVWKQNRTAITRTPCPRCKGSSSGKLWCWLTKDGYGWGERKAVSSIRAVCADVEQHREKAVEACMKPSVVFATDPVEALKLFALVMGIPYIEV